MLRLKTYMLLENNQSMTQCLAKRKNTDKILFAKRKSAQYTI